ncbi:MAG: hypothetical protein AABY11_00930, partial [archaeon]
MAKPPRASGKKRSGVVHFVFRGHAARQKFFPVPARKETRTVLVEDGYGITLEAEKKLSRIFSEPNVRKKIRFDVRPMSASLNRGLAHAASLGMRIASGEVTSNLGAFTRLMDRENRHKKSAVVNPTVANIRRYFETEARIMKIRHGLIRRRVRQIVEGGEAPIDAYYGTAHSLLSRELKDEGIQTTRDIDPIVFPGGGILLRQLMRGKNPREIS